MSGRIFLLVVALALFACKREERGFRVKPPPSQSSQQTLSDLVPGGKTPPPAMKNDYEENAYAISEGQRLYQMYNCVGCHAHGGGGMGPALMDAKWIYGSNPEQIYATIVEGRPNGMPTFRGKIPDNQVWQLVAYVRSLCGLVAFDAAGGRDDHMKGPLPPNSVPKETPKNSSLPKSAEMPGG
jgi:cytochrome c oxidase cbb3-type subunit 3